MARNWLATGIGLLLAGAGLAAEARPSAERDRAVDHRAIVEGERAWGQTYVTGDVASVRLLLADSFHGVDTHGALFDKAAVIRDVAKGPRGTSDEVGPVTVRFYGETAIAQAHEYEVGPAPERTAVERVFTDTWVKMGGRWRIVASEDLDPGSGTSGTSGFGAYAKDKRAILALRQANNRALAAHDLDATMSIVADNYVMTGGNSGIERSVAENRKAWSEEFATPGHDRYVRTTVGLEVGERKGVLRAAENGTWEGIDHKEAGDARPWGRYFIHWSKVSGRWRIVSESYVTMGCHGPGC